MQNTKPTFNFMSQSEMVQRLLNEAQALVERLPEKETEALVSAMRVFEEYGVPTLWAPEDVDSDGSLGLTDDEKRSVIRHFIDGYVCKDGDWLVIQELSQSAIEDRNHATAPQASDRFILNATGDEVTDTQTGLIWQRCLIGQTWDGQQTQGEVSMFTWDEAMAYAAAQPDGWRLPTVEEFRSLFKGNNALFKGNKPEKGLLSDRGWAWSASPYADYPDYAWIVFFYYGSDYGYVKNYNGSVRLVRSQ